MIKTIIVPLDRSSGSESALESARFLAAEFGASIKVITTTVAGDPSDSSAYLQQAVRPMVDDGVDVTTETVVHSVAERGILDTLHNTDDAILCMATHGRGTVGALVLGSVADAIVARTVAPVVLVGPNCGPGDPTVRRLVFCWDRSALSGSVEETVVNWAKSLGLEVWLVTVRTARDAESGEPVSRLHDEVEEIASRLRSDGLHVHTSILDSPDAAKAVTGLAEELHATLIATATHGESGFAKTALGRVATSIVRHSPCPVIVERPHG